MSQEPTEQTSSQRLELIKDMKAWSEANPPAEGWSTRGQPAIVHLHPHVRLSISVERVAGEVGYGLARTEELSERGIFDAELDSAAFAKELMKVLAAELSRRNLEDLMEAIRQEQACFPGERVAKVAQIQGAGEQHVD